ncbi:MAG: hypothetical protein K0Q52_3903, partial [Microbacterium sp.]|nr:hypothetical protein [Microbacterium sp.]
MSTDAFSPVLFPRLDGRADGAVAEAEAAQSIAAAQQAARDDAAAREVESAVSALHAAARSLSERERELTAAGGDEVLRCAIELAELLLGAELSDPGSSAAAAARR